MEIFIIIALTCVIVFMLFNKASNTDSLLELDKLKRENEKLELQVSVYSKNVQEYAKTVPEEVHLKAVQERQSMVEFLRKEVSTLQAAGAEIAEQLRQEKSRTKSEQVRIGLVSENVLPFTDQFPYNPRNIVAIFRPVDFLVFNEDSLIFVEVKTGNSQQSPKQKNIQRIIEEHKVFYEIHRLNEKGYSIKKRGEEND